MVEKVQRFLSSVSSRFRMDDNRFDYDEEYKTQAQNVNAASAMIKEMIRVHQ